MNEPKFKVGDKVRIAESKNKEMIGKTATINQVFFDNQSWRGASVYGVSVDNKKTLYSEVFLEAAKESNPKFKVGDKVKIVKLGFGISDKTLTGKKFTVKSVEEKRGIGTVYKLSDPNDFSWLEWQLELVTDFPKIIITTDGKTTLARLYDGKKVMQTAEAHCSPDDKFDFSVGANLAMERLIGKVTTIQISTEIPKEITDKFETIKATGKAFVKALEEFK